MGHNSFAIFSLNGYIRFPVFEFSKVNPFVSAGYTAGVTGNFGPTVHHMSSFGTGLNYWFLRRIALRTELRDYVRPGASPSSHFWGFRLGLAFR